jgi:S1-C subfamily serine protease
MSRTNRPLAAGALIALLSLGTAACNDSTSRSSAATKPASSAGGDGTSVGSEATQVESAFVQVVDRVRPTVVEISTPSGLGSGVMYDGKGDIVTNAHVVGDSTQFQVTLVDGHSLPGELVGTFPPDDLAVVRVSGSGAPAAAKFDDSSTVKVGQIVMAVGNPLGLESSVTDGIVSSTGRTVSEGGGVVLPSTIQTSAPINPGNSGGALVGLDGDVIGIPTLAAVTPDLGAAPGIGFAVPSNTVKRIADQLISSGKVTDSGRAALGISGTNVVTGSGAPFGVLVQSIEPDKAAQAAGISPGDVITSVAGKPTTTMEELQSVLADLSPGQTVPVEVVHSDGSRASYQVTLSSL